MAGVEVKAAATVTAADFRGLKKLREAAAERFGERLFAVPIRTLWEAR